MTTPIVNPVIAVHHIYQSDTSGELITPLTKTFELLTQSFVVPAIGASVGIVVEDSSRYAVGQYVYIPGAGYFEITALTSTTGIYVKNNGDTGTYSAGTSVPAGTPFMPCPPSIYVASPIEYQQAGTTALATTNANDTLGATVTFPVAFSVVPSAVVLSIQKDTAIGAVAAPLVVYAKDITATGFKIYYTAGAVFSFNVKWIAMV